MNSNLSKFLNQLSTDKKLAAEFFQKQALKDQHKFALAHSDGGFSEQELQEALDALEIYFDQLQEGNLSESDLERVAGGDPETQLRSIAMMVPSIVTLITAGGELISRYFATKKRYESEQDKLRIVELEEKLKELQKAREPQILSALEE